MELVTSTDVEIHDVLRSVYRSVRLCEVQLGQRHSGLTRERRHARSQRPSTRCRAARHVVVPIGSHSHRLEIATIESVTAAEHGFDQLQGVLRLGIVRRSLHDSVGLRWAWRETGATGRFGEKMDARLRRKAEHVIAPFSTRSLKLPYRSETRWPDGGIPHRPSVDRYTDLILPHAARDMVNDLPPSLCGIGPPDWCRRMHDNNVAISPDQARHTRLGSDDVVDCRAHQNRRPTMRWPRVNSCVHSRCRWMDALVVQRSAWSCR